MGKGDRNMQLSHDRAMSAACYVRDFLLKDNAKKYRILVGYFGDTRT